VITKVLTKGMLLMRCQQFPPFPQLYKNPSGNNLVIRVVLTQITI